MMSCILIFSLLKVNNTEHNRIVSRHNAFVSRTNVNCLTSEEVQHLIKPECESACSHFERLAKLSEAKNVIKTIAVTANCSIRLFNS